MAQDRKQLIITDLRSGINQIDPPLATGAGDRFMQDARNIEFHAGGVCKKRQGSDEPNGLTYTATGKYASLFRHVLGKDEQTTELWTVTDGAKLGRMEIDDLEFVSVTPGDAISSSYAQYADAVSFNGKLFLAYKSAADRLHVWDGTELRRVGQGATAAAPTTVKASGAVTDKRRYRVTYIKKVGSPTATIELRSEPSTETAVVELTAQKCTVTKNTSPGETETHWELWASSDATNYGTWYKLGEAALATTSIEDNNVDLSVPTGLTAEYLGENTTFKSARFLAVDENRLLAAGSWEEPEYYASRVWFSAVLGSTDIGDDERTPDSIGASQKFYVDVGRGIDGGITGIAGPLYDSIYVFKLSSIWKLVKTGVVENPYRVVNVHRNIGAINHKTIVLGEDEAGQPALYFLSRRGPYRLGTRGLEYLGSDIETTFATINLDAEDTIGHGVYHHRKHQVWWWVSTGDANTPNLVMVYDTQRGITSETGVRGGWTFYDGKVSNAFASVMYSKELGGASASLDMKPYFGAVETSAKLVMADVDDTFTDYDGSGYQSYFITRAHALGALQKTVRVNGIAVLAKPDDTYSPCLWVRALRNWGTNWSEYHLSIPPSDNVRVLVNQPEPTTLRQGPSLNDLVGFHVYDSAAQGVGWQLDALICEYSIDGER